MPSIPDSLACLPVLPGLMFCTVENRSISGLTVTLLPVAIRHKISAGGLPTGNTVRFIIFHTFTTAQRGCCESCTRTYHWSAFEFSFVCRFTLLLQFPHSQACLLLCCAHMHTIDQPSLPFPFSAKLPRVLNSVVIRSEIIVLISFQSHHMSEAVLRSAGRSSEFCQPRSRQVLL